jgi:hypothetical protein
MGLMLSATTMTSSSTTAMIVNGSGFLFNVLMSGTFYVADTVTWILRWLEFLSPSYYTALMMAQNELAGVAGSEDLLDGPQYDQVGEWTAFLLMLAVTIVYITTCLAVLLFRAKHS